MEKEIRIPKSVVDETGFSGIFKIEEMDHNLTINSYENKPTKAKISGIYCRGSFGIEEDGNNYLIKIIYKKI